MRFMHFQSMSAIVARTLLRAACDNIMPDCDDAPVPQLIELFMTADLYGERSLLDHVSLSLTSAASDRMRAVIVVDQCDGPALLRFREMALAFITEVLQGARTAHQCTKCNHMYFGLQAHANCIYCGVTEFAPVASRYLNCHGVSATTLGQLFATFAA
jgi:hypothetical protein